MEILLVQSCQPRGGDQFGHGRLLVVPAGHVKCCPPVLILQIEIDAGRVEEESPDHDVTVSDRLSQSLPPSHVDVQPTAVEFVELGVVALLAGGEEQLLLLHDGPC